MLPAASDQVVEKVADDASSLRSAGPIIEGAKVRVTSCHFSGKNSIDPSYRGIYIYRLIRNWDSATSFKQFVRGCIYIVVSSFQLISIMYQKEV